ncbi:substrate-binding periplasmic protein [Primorskyibacter marinus]|uniref:substrate-binding periplasmic protein n=1 Tax=Primorskyibacter marinus TaxID=1977320 RepID=UPI000E3041B4|nr:transporter substrate-binding domain-containing protein [Primorskyibacter marinus]
MAPRFHSPFRWRPVVINVAVVSLLMFGLSYVPADTSLSEIKRRGTLRVCIPPSRPPLVTGDPTYPGFDVGLMLELSESMGITLKTRVVSAMGADFNPRNWRLSRSQCDVIAGGIVDSEETRGFLQTLPTDVQMGWGVIRPNTLVPEPRESVAVLPAPGLDRLALSQILRAEKADVVLVRDEAALIAALTTGRVRIGLADKGIADRLAQDRTDLTSAWFKAEGVARQSFALGFWKGDVELRRAFAHALSDMDEDGRLDDLRSQYGLPVAD